MSRLRERLYKDYELDKYGFDFMGYEFHTKNELSTHHIIPRYMGGKTKKDNLCILTRDTAHNYIHLIQDYDYKVFLQISKCLVEQVKRGAIDLDELKRINEILVFFEDKYQDAETKSGELLIRPEYKTKRITRSIE